VSGVWVWVSSNVNVHVSGVSFTIFVFFYRIPRVTIATDIICGFPTETEANFQETMSLCEKNKFKSLFINQFYPRNGTPAARMKRIDTVEASVYKLCSMLLNQVHW
jgi:tRNA A37 methylthiotransferase MiaB